MANKEGYSTSFEFMRIRGKKPAVARLDFTDYDTIGGIIGTHTRDPYWILDIPELGNGRQEAWNGFTGLDGKLYYAFVHAQWAGQRVSPAQAYEIELWFEVRGPGSPTDDPKALPQLGDKERAIGFLDPSGAKWQAWLVGANAKKPIQFLLKKL